MKQFLLHLFLLTSFAATTALAAAPEVCGSGIDEPEMTGGTPNGTAGSCPGGYIDAVVGNGCDLLCPGCDGDLDGYCDDGSPGTIGEKRASNTFGTSNASLYVEARDPGTDGNSIRVRLVDPGGSGSLSVGVSSLDITVTLAHNGSAITSTANDVALALMTDASASLLVNATRANGTGASAVSAVGFTSLSGGLLGSTAVDCNPNSKWEFLGVARFCDPAGAPTEGTQICQADGTWTTCTDTVLCEATGSGVCKYVDCGSGSNSNSGTYASPYLTLGKIAGGSSGSPPASPFTLIAGSVVYIKGSGTCDTMYTKGGGGLTQAELTVAGTTTDPIRIKRYPGSAAIVDCDEGYCFNHGSSGKNYIFEDLEFTGRCTASSGSNSTPILAFGGGGIGENTFVDRIYVHDWSGSSFNNDSMVYLNTASGGKIYRSLFKDWEQGSASCNNPGSGQNINAVKFLADNNSGYGLDLQVKYSTMFRSTPSSGFGTEGGCFFWKHGLDGEDCDGQPTTLAWNTCVNATLFTSISTSCMRIHDNRVVDTDKTLYAVQDSGTMEDNIIEYNLFRGPNWQWNEPPFDTVLQRFVSRRNIFFDTSASWSAGDSEGVYSIAGYGSNAQKTSFESNKNLLSDYNTFYCPNATCSFCYFCQDSGGWGPAGNAGDDYNFADFKTATGTDASSVMENPNLNSFLEPQAAGSLNKGPRYVQSSELPPDPDPDLPRSGVRKLLYGR